MVGPVQFTWTWWWSENSELQGIVVSVDYDFKKKERIPKNFTGRYRFAVEIKGQKPVKEFSRYQHYSDVL